MVTSKDTALENAKKRLNNDPAELKKEIESQISRMFPSDTHVSFRAGDYTPEVIQSVLAEYARRGWQHRVKGYWGELY